MDVLIRVLAADTSVYGDDLLVVDSTPIECARSRETVKRSDLAGWAEYGYCASHSRYFWGLRLHLLATTHGLPIAYALTGVKADERTALLGMLDTNPSVTNGARTVMADKNYYGHAFETALAATGLTILRPARAGEKPRPGARLLNPYANASNRPSTPAKTNSTWNATAGAPPPASPCACCNACSPSPPSSGTTTTPANQPADP